MPFLLIANPWASGVDEAGLAAVRAALPEGTELRLTSRGGEATEIAREVSGRVDALYVFGGDGTYNEVLNGIDAETPVGFVPGGGASVLPRALGLPREPFEAAQRLAAGESRRIAVGRVNGHRFGFACGIGLDAEVVRAVDELGRREDGRRPGQPRVRLDRACARSGATASGSSPTLEVKGYGRAAFAFVSNGPAYTYAGRVAVQASPGGDLRGRPRSRRARPPARARSSRVSRGTRAAAATGREAEDLVYVHDADRIEIVVRPAAAARGGRRGPG